MQVFANIWVFATLLLYYFGPLPWEGAQDPWVAVVVITAMAGLNLGCLSIPSSSRCSYKTVIPLRVVESKTIAYAIIIAFVLLTAFQIYRATGRLFLLPSDWSLDFGAVYAEYQESTKIVKTSTPFTSMLSLAKTALFPVALIIFCRYFLRDKLITVLFMFPMVASSFMRGTDKEFFDIILIFIVAAFFHGYKRTLAIAGAILIPLFIFVFIERKIGRNSGILECIGGFCLNYDSLLARISPKLEFGWAMMTFYITNGYQGLSVALGVPFEFHYGVGHLPPVERTLCSVTGWFGDISTYNQRITAAGWDASGRWTTVYPTLANDLNFFFIPAYMFLLGRIMRAAELFFLRDRNPVALATLIMFAIFFAYSSANMQVAISLDWAFAWIVLVYIPLFTLTVGEHSTDDMSSSPVQATDNDSQPTAHQGDRGECNPRPRLEHIDT